MVADHTTELDLEQQLALIHERIRHLHMVATRSKKPPTRGEIAWFARGMRVQRLTVQRWLNGDISFPGYALVVIELLEHLHAMNRRWPATWYPEKR